jgi:hypothetical protein
MASNLFQKWEMMFKVWDGWDTSWVNSRKSVNCIETWLWNW